MMRTFLILFAVLSIQAGKSQANTIEESAALQASLDARNQFVVALENKDFVGVTHQGFDVAIQKLAEQIREDLKDEASADELLKLWSETSPSFVDQVAFSASFNDLGDHAPLFAWLENFFQDLAKKYGTIILTLPIVKEIQMLNYAIPVVFSPQGAWRVAGTDNRIEYRKHFIPFANIITYYVTLYGCQYYLAQHGQSNLKKICGKAADQLRFVMGRYIAPVVSDWIYNATNRSMTVSNYRLQYRSASELRRAIQY